MPVPVSLRAMQPVTCVVVTRHCPEYASGHIVFNKQSDIDF